MSLSEQSFTAENIQSWLVSQLAESLQVEPADIDITAPLDSYGLDSAQAMLLAAKAGKYLGFQLSPLLLWHYPTIESLSERLAEEAENSASEIFEI
jgi:acyl carrier protein